MDQDDEKSEGEEIIKLSNPEILYKKRTYASRVGDSTVNIRMENLLQIKPIMIT